jgi:hypothetical protein
MKRYVGVICMSAGLAFALLVPVSWIRSISALFGL